MGTDGSISRLPDHLWVPAALPSVSRLGSACQLENAGHLSVPLRLRGRAHLYPRLGGDRALAGRTGLCSACEGSSLVRLGLCSASPRIYPVLWLCSWPLCLPGALWKSEAGVRVSVRARMHECGCCCMHVWVHMCSQLCVHILVCTSSQGFAQAARALLKQSGLCVFCTHACADLTVRGHSQ